MKNNRNLAKIIYNGDEDRYELLLSTDAGKSWDFSWAAECVSLYSDGPTSYIHYSFISAICNAINNGFTFV